MYRKRNLYNEALQEGTQAMTAIANGAADSLKCILYMELGDIYISKAQAVPAYKNYNIAYDIAYKQKLPALQSQIYHRFSDLYRSFGNTDMAKSYLMKSLELDTKNNLLVNKFNDYISLAKLTNMREYIEQADGLAGTLNSYKYKQTAQRLLYYWYMVEGKNSDSTFRYLFSHPELLQFFKNSGPEHFYLELANIYHFSGKNDSAIYFYRLAETGLATGDNAIIKSGLYMSMADSYLERRDSTDAKEYYLRSFTLYKQLGDLNSISGISAQLSILYAAFSDFRPAYYYQAQADSVNAILQSNAANDKVVLLQVERENNSRLMDLEELTAKAVRRNNLQIMAITLMLTLFFAVMLFAGMFAVSKTIIRMLGYFAFISLFEFIVLLLDEPIVHFTQGEPLKIWGVKILLIALLVPLQHFLEHRLIRFLQSQKLMEARQKISIKKWFYRNNKPIGTLGGEDMEEDTAVL